MSDPTNVSEEDLNLNHLSTVWQIAEDNDFNNIIWEWVEDDVYLTSKEASVTLMEEVSYYARARYVYEEGLSKWSNVDILIKPATILETSLPRIVPTPVIRTDFNKDEHPFSLFKMYIDNDFTFPRNVHISTTWLIEDDEGTVIFHSKEDTNNLTEMIYTEFLNTNKVYTIRAKIHLISGDVSELGGINIYVSHNRNHDILFLRSKYFAIAGNVKMRLERVANYQYAEIEVYEDFNSILTINNNEVDLDMNTLNLTVNNKYLVRNKVITSDGIINESSFYIIRVMSDYTVTCSRFESEFPLLFCNEDQNACGSFPIDFPVNFKTENDHPISFPFESCD